MLYKQILFCPNTSINIDKLEKYFSHNENNISIYSTEGLYTIMNNYIYNINTMCNKSYIQTFNNIQLYINEMREIKNKVNYIPFEHISINVNKKVFKLNKYSNLEFIIEENILDNKEPINSDYDYKENIIYYFILKNNYDLENPLIKEELISFFDLLY
jgi:hypothetical protein